ncbi:MAG: Gfo/Idh/MocA family oxidoreductase [Trueperaceae bacterium]|nr:Gfo/Idh/MocA family oxidoreductase [Trueperaceae bacterium]
MAPLRLAVIGCGKVSERLHLPVSAASDAVEVTALVDRDTERARALAHTYGVGDVFADVSDLPGRVDAAIVAVPHHLHVEIASALLAKGVHVLVEKPMALDVAGCDAMIEAAEAGGATLAVGLVRRFYEASRYVKDLLDDGVLGALEHVDTREGAVFNWQVASPATFRKEMGGGVLSDVGTHVLDLLVWWLGETDDLRYEDDAMGGVEADCELRATFGGTPGVVELSRTRVLRNSTIIRGERGVVEIGPGFDPPVHLTFGGRTRRLIGAVEAAGTSRAARLEDVFARQLDDFAGAIREGRAPFIPGREGKRSIALLEACRRVRRPLELPWLSPGHERPPQAVEG